MIRRFARGLLWYVFITECLALIASSAMIGYFRAPRERITVLVKPETIEVSPSDLQIHGVSPPPSRPGGAATTVVDGVVLDMGEESNIAGIEWLPLSAPNYRITCVWIPYYVIVAQSVVVISTYLGITRNRGQKGHG